MVHEYNPSPWGIEARWSDVHVFLGYIVSTRSALTTRDHDKQTLKSLSYTPIFDWIERDPCHSNEPPSVQAKHCHLPGDRGERLQLQAVESPPPMLLLSEPSPATADHVLQERGGGKTIEKWGRQATHINCGNTARRLQSQRNPKSRKLSSNRSNKEIHMQLAMQGLLMGLEI